MIWQVLAQVQYVVPNFLKFKCKFKRKCNFAFAFEFALEFENTITTSWGLHVLLGLRSGSFILR